MILPEKYTCRQVANALAAFGIKDVVTSPGSRNAPLLIAVERHPNLNVHSVVDERSAGFIALGIAEISGNAVALICTSGSALLNYGPTVAEAYYKKLPLIIISADRPIEWIDQADGQTIRQHGALTNFCKSHYSLKSEANCVDDKWFVDRLLNEAVEKCISHPYGPVHINISISEPICKEAEIAGEHFHAIKFHRPDMMLDTFASRSLADYISNKSVLIVAGFYHPESVLSRALTRLSKLPNIVILTESISNVKADGIIENPELLLSKYGEKLPYPDLLISFGGSIVSKSLKSWLRSSNIKEHWHIGIEHNVVDTFMKLTDAYSFLPEKFFPRFATAAEHRKTSVDLTKSTFSEEYHRAYKIVLTQCELNTSDAELNKEWNTICAFKKVLQSIPKSWNIQISNGLAVRYAQLFPLTRHRRIDSNRGVSGIDGSTSTALGASIAYKSGATLLLTGDMSFIYDIGALTSGLVNSKLKIVVVNNGGGGIFKTIPTTSGLPEVNRLFHGNLQYDIEKIATAFGFNYCRANDYNSLNRAIKMLVNNNSAPIIVEIESDTETDKSFINKLKSQHTCEIGKQ